MGGSSFAVWRPSWLELQDGRIGVFLMVGSWREQVGNEDGTG